MMFLKLFIDEGEGAAANQHESQEKRSNTALEPTLSKLSMESKVI